MRTIYKIAIIALVALPLLYANAASAASDSRMQTYIYGKNDIFRIITSYGFQTSIELDAEEIVQTISVGNSAAFKVNPSGTRIFIRSLQTQQTTNMTVVTDKRTYLFELVSTDESAADLMYVVRFYFPDGDGASSAPRFINSASQSIGGPDSMAAVFNPPSAPSASPSINVPRVSISGDIPQQPGAQAVAMEKQGLQDFGNAAQQSVPVAGMQTETIRNAPTVSSIPASLRYKYNNSF